MEGYKYLFLIDRSDVGIKYRVQAQVKNADGSVLTDRALVKDVIVYDPDGKDLPLDGSFLTWNGSNVHADSGGGPAPSPLSDIEVSLAASPGSLPDGFYTELITDSNRNPRMGEFWHEGPTEVGKPTNLMQINNPDNSITLSWTNPAGIAGPNYFLSLFIQHSDENGDGLDDLDLILSRGVPTNSYTIPASFVSSNLAGKQGLEWNVQVRQQTGLNAFPDGTSSTEMIYRNYSADQPLSLTPPPAIQFTPEMLAGQGFSSKKNPPDAGVLNES